MKSKMLTGLLSVAIALSLWLYVVTFVSPTTDKQFQNIPVSLQGETLLQERGLMITSTQIPAVTLHLEGNRTNLNKLTNSNITVSADVSRIAEVGTHRLTITPLYPGDVPNNAINVLSQSPGVITVEVEKRISKEVPVDVEYTGALSDGYMADKENKVMSHEVVSISGPQSVVDQIAAAKIVVDLNNKVESISETFAFTLCDVNDQPVDAQLITTNTAGINMTLKILRIKELQLVVNVIDGGGATKDNSDIILSHQSILVSGSDRVLEGVDSVELGTIDLTEILEDQVLTFPVKLPEGVTNETGVTEVTVDVQFSKLATKKIKVTNIEAVNVPEGLKAELITQRLDIQIRGPKNTVEKIDASQIVVKVDLTDAQTGMATVKAEIIIDANKVGAVGTYNVTAKLSAA